MIPKISSQCSPLRPALTWQFQWGGNSWKVLPLQSIAAHSYMAVSVGGWWFLKYPPNAAHCGPLLHGNFSQGVIPENSSRCSPLQPTLTWQFQSWGVIPEKSSHCSPLLHGNFSHGGNSWKVLPLQPTFTWQFQWGGNSWKVLPLQSIAAHSYMAISVGGWWFLKYPPNAAHCGPLLHGNFSEGVIPEKSSHCSPLQPTLTWHIQWGG